MPRAVLAVCSVLLAFLLLIGASGFILFTNAPTDPLQRADAVVVLGGEHDGREDYGIALARNGWAPTVLISNPYHSSDPVMRRVCGVRRRHRDHLLATIPADDPRRSGIGPQAREPASVEQDHRRHLEISRTTGSAGVSAMFFPRSERRRDAGRPPALRLFAGPVGVDLRLSIWRFPESDGPG